MISFTSTRLITTICNLSIIASSLGITSLANAGDVGSSGTSLSAHKIYLSGMSEISTIDPDSLTSRTEAAELKRLWDNLALVTLPETFANDATKETAAFASLEVKNACLKQYRSCAVKWANEFASGTEGGNSLRQSKAVVWGWEVLESASGNSENRINNSLIRNHHFHEIPKTFNPSKSVANTEIIANAIRDMKKMITRGRLAIEDLNHLGSAVSSFGSLDNVRFEGRSNNNGEIILGLVSSNPKPFTDFSSADGLGKCYLFGIFGCRVTETASGQTGVVTAVEGTLNFNNN